MFYEDITLVECVEWKKQQQQPLKKPPTFWVGSSESRAVKLNLFINSSGRVPQIKPNSAQPPWSPAGRLRPALCAQLFNSLSLNLFTNDLVRGNTYQLPVSANKPPAPFFAFCTVGSCLQPHHMQNSPPGPPANINSMILQADSNAICKFCCQKNLCDCSAPQVCGNGLHKWSFSAL